MKHTGSVNATERAEREASYERGLTDMRDAVAIWLEQRGETDVLAKFTEQFYVPASLARGETE